MSTTSIIGGMFGHDQTPGQRQSLLSALPPHRARGLYTAARCGLRAAAAGPSVGRVWLPSYLCEAMIDGLSGINQQIRYYPVDPDLQVSERSWVSSLTDRDLVVVIAYFGVRPSPDFVASVKSQSACILLDAAACPPIVGADWGADAILYSPRKLTGVPDGGILLDLTGRIGPLPIPNECEAEWGALAEDAFAARTEFDREGACGDDRRWYHLQQEWERRFPAGIWAMSQRARAILEQGLPWTEMVARRSANHSSLAARLRPVGLPSLAAQSACPLGYVIAFESAATRDAVRSALIAEKIYPPIHWHSPPAAASKFAASRNLAERVLTLPCDQRYSATDMQRIATTVLSTIGATS